MFEYFEYAEEPLTPAKPPLWTLEEGVTLARSAENVALTAGFHCALAGGVLMKGASKKDLDLIFYVSKTEEGVDFLLLVDNLKQLGFKEWKLRTPYHREDRKIVYSTSYKGKRVDIFIMANP